MSLLNQLIDMTKSRQVTINGILCREPDPAFGRRARIILENLDLSGKEKILEIGCGRGFYLKTLINLWPNLMITGLDLNEKYLNIARQFVNNQKVKLIQGDAISLPFANQSFGRIIATEILEHIPDDQKAISEMYRVLKPGGIAMITVPNKNYPFFWDPLNWLLERIFNCHIPAHIWWLAGLWADHQRLYNKDDLKTKLTQAGFKIEENWQATHFCFPFAHFLLYGIGKNIVEKGLLKSFNRFKIKPKRSWLNLIFLWPLRKIDQQNEKNQNFSSSVNIILKIIKE